MTVDGPPPVPGRRRPWWLIADSPGRAVLYAAFAGIQAWVFFLNNGRHVLPQPLVIGWVVLIAAMFVGCVVTLIALHRHPDWVNKVWSKPVLGRRARLALALGVAVGVIGTVIGVIVAAVTASDAPAVVALAAFVTAAICAAILGTHPSERRDRTSAATDDE